VKNKFYLIPVLVLALIRSSGVFAYTCSTAAGTIGVAEPGDLVDKVYLANSGNLTKAYQYLNMKLYLEGSVEAGETPNYRLLTLENGMATFRLEDGGSDNHTLPVSGGDYTLNSREPSEWEAGWTVSPEFYCEVTQR